MTDASTIFEDGEDLQNAIGKSLQERKALLCFVSDDGDESTQWKTALLDQRIRDKLQTSTVVLNLKAGSEQAGFLNAVCPVQSTPAVIIISNAQVIGNYQLGQTTLEQLQQQLDTRYASSTIGEAAESSKPPVKSGYLDLPTPDGRMRLPNNAYDHLRKLTQQYVSSGVSGKGLLHIQLKILESLHIEMVTDAVKTIQSQADTAVEPSIPDDVVDKLLNTSASQIRRDIVPNENRPANTRSSDVGTNQTSTTTPTSQSNTATTPRTAHSIQAQRQEYNAAKRVAEAERQRVMAQVDADRKIRRQADLQAREEAEIARRRAELHELRKANSTTANPQSTDVRLQVRLFDGSTIRNSFAAESTISKDVRPWIDTELTKKAVAGGSISSQPYDLKLLLTPLPNRTIEAGEEDSHLADVEGVKGSATLIMVPVKGYVNSYSGSSGGAGAGLLGGVVEGVQTAVGASIGLVGAAAGMFAGGLGRLMGAGAPAAPTRAAQTQSGQSTDAGQGARSGGAGSSNARVRTLGDQRRDEEDEARKKGTQLYNGMGLNVQPRKDGDKDKDKDKDNSRA